VALMKFGPAPRNAIYAPLPTRSFWQGAKSRISRGSERDHRVRLGVSVHHQTRRQVSERCRVRTFGLLGCDGGSTHAWNLRSPNVRTRHLSKDKSFATRLHDQLQAQGIRCWRDEVDARVGDPIAHAIDRGFKLTERVILCCSEASLNSTWVSRELNKTFAKEEKLTAQGGEPHYILLPLSLDGYLFKKDDDGEYIWQHHWADEIRSRIAADFNGWEGSNDVFEEQIEWIVGALKPDAGEE